MNKTEEHPWRIRTALDLGDVRKPRKTKGRKLNIPGRDTTVLVKERKDFYITTS